MRTEQIIRKFEELNEANQAKAIEDTRNSDGYLDYEWYDGTEEDFLTTLKLLGYYDIETYFSGFQSQGDGASFKAKYSYGKDSLKKIIEYAPKDEELHRIASELKAMQRIALWDVGATITTHGRYCHEMTMSADMYSYNGRVKDETAWQHESSFLELSRDLARWYYKSLQNDYEYLMSDEAIKEHLKASETEYDYEQEELLK